MKEFRELAKRFTTSRAIFRLTINDDHDSIDSYGDPDHTYRPVAEDGNVLDEILVSNFTERFDANEGVFKIDREEICSRAMSDVKNKIAEFIENHLEMKNPRQSKVYRWMYRGTSGKPHLNDVFIMVYKYIRSFTLEDMRASGDQSAHIKNALALLAAMEEKYSE